MSVFQGKIVSGTRYAHKSAVSLLPNTEQQLIEKMHAFLDIDTAWNVVKLEIKKPTNFSFLCYQDFSDAEFPALLKSYKYNNCDHTFKLTRYNSKNPPILHRKELLLPSDHPDYLKYETLTNNLIVLGAFQNMHRHGTKKRWQEWLESLGIVVNNHNIQKVLNTKV